MKFHELSEAFQKIAKTSSRLEITHILAELFTTSTPHEAQIIANLCLGSLRPPYEGTQFNIAERSMKGVVAGVLGISAEEVSKRLKKEGDLGLVVSQGSWHALVQPSVTEVYDALVAIEHIEGQGSQEKRAELLSKLLQAVNPLDAAIVVRMILGKLRLGFSDMTIIDALSWMLTGDKSLRAQIEHGYNVCADLGYIAALLKEHGVSGLDKVTVVVGIPIRPAAAERLPTAQEIIEKLGPCVAEPKLDGFRLQVHIDARGKERKLHFFSRNLLDMSAMFPDVAAALEALPVTDIIMEGEAIVFDQSTGTFPPFQETVKRKRKHDIAAVAQELPLKLFIFDILYLNGQSLLDRELHTRREILQKLFKNYKQDVVHVIEERPVTTAKELESYFLEAIEAGLEGLVVKKPKSHYQPGKRNFNWIKLKRQEGVAGLEDTLDLVVLGYYAGQGKRTHFGMGAFLVGAYHKQLDRFETIAKVGTGLTDAEWKALKKKCDEYATAQKPPNVVCAKELAPDVWVNPEIVVQIRADEITQSPLHTVGFALRFPRMMGYRPDKSARDATTVDEVKALYKHQRS